MRAAHPETSGLGWVGLTLALLPATAGACPYCAARDATGPQTIYFIAAMCLLPLVVGGLALIIIRKLDSAPAPNDGEHRP